jgi:hypothetical protein
MYWLWLYPLICYLTIIPFLRWIIKPLWGTPSQADAGFFLITAPISLPVGLAIVTITESCSGLSKLASFLIGE